MTFTLEVAWNFKSLAKYKNNPANGIGGCVSFLLKVKCFIRHCGSQLDNTDCCTCHKRLVTSCSPAQLIEGTSSAALLLLACFRKSSPSLRSKPNLRKRRGKRKEKKIIILFSNARSFKNEIFNGNDAMKLPNLVGRDSSVGRASDWKARRSTQWHGFESPRVTCQCRLSYGARTAPVFNRMHQHLRAR